MRNVFDSFPWGLRPQANVYDPFRIEIVGKSDPKGITDISPGLRVATSRGWHPSHSSTPAGVEECTFEIVECDLAKTLKKLGLLLDILFC